MADSLESTCSRPDDPVLPEHPEKAMRCMLSEVLEDDAPGNSIAYLASTATQQSTVERGQAPVTGAAARGTFSRFAATGCRPQTQVLASFLFSVAVS